MKNGKLEVIATWIWVWEFQQQTHATMNFISNQIVIAGKFWCSRKTSLRYLIRSICLWFSQLWAKPLIRSVRYCLWKFRSTDKLIDESRDKEPWGKTRRWRSLDMLHEFQRSIEIISIWTLITSLLSRFHGSRRARLQILLFLVPF